MPWPAKEASPWMRIGNIRSKSLSWSTSAFARGKPDHDGIDGFEVRGVGHQFELNDLVGFSLDRAAVAHVIFHIPAAHGLVQLGGAFELAEDLLVGFAHDVSQDVEAAAVGHADHYFPDV